jgi:hypothetical protein
MERKIKIFKSFEEQEEYHLNEMRNTTVSKGTLHEFVQNANAF